MHPLVDNFPSLQIDIAVMLFCVKEIARQEKLLEAKVKLPAEASKYEMEKMAEANLKKVVLNAEATAEAVRVCSKVSFVKFLRYLRLLGSPT